LLRLAFKKSFRPNKYSWVILELLNTYRLHVYRFHLHVIVDQLDGQVN